MLFYVLAANGVESEREGFICEELWGAKDDYDHSELDGESEKRSKSQKE